jgi:hypothetical protein
MVTRLRGGVMLVGTIHLAASWVVARCRRAGRGEGVLQPTRLPADCSAGRRVHRDLQVGTGQIASIEGVDLPLHHARVGGAVVAHHQHDIGSQRIQQTGTAIDDLKGA